MAGTNILVRQKDLIAGSGISITPDTTSGNVTIAATSTAIDESRLVPTGGKEGEILSYQEGADQGNGSDVRLLLQNAMTDSANGNAAPAAVTTQGVTLTGDNNLLFDGNDSHVTAVLATDEIFAADKEWTIDFWMKPTANSSDWNYILTENLGDWGSHSIGLTWHKSTNVLEQDTGGYVASVIKAPNWPNNSIACAANEWHFIAVEKQKTATGWSLNYYLNGAIWLQVAFTGEFVPFTSDNPFWFGGKTTDSGRWFKGEVNKLRVTMGARYGSKAFAVPDRLTDYAAPAGQPVWTEGIDRSRLLPEDPANGDIPCFDATATTGGGNDANTKILLHFDADEIKDEAAGNAAPVTITKKSGTITIVEGGKWGKCAKYVTGSMTVATNLDELNANNWVVSGWFNPDENNHGVSYPTWLSMDDQNTHGFGFDSTGRYGESDGPLFYLDTPPASGTWHWLAIVKYSGGLRFYLNGAFLNEISAQQRANFCSTLAIGGFAGTYAAGSTERTFSGLVDEVRLQYIPDDEITLWTGTSIAVPDAPYSKPQTVGEWGKFNKSLLAQKSDLTTKADKTELLGKADESQLANYQPLLPVEHQLPAAIADDHLIMSEVTTSTIPGANDDTVKFLLQPATSSNQVVDSAAGNTTPLEFTNNGVTADSDGVMTFSPTQYAVIPANTVSTGLIDILLNIPVVPDDDVKYVLFGSGPESNSGDGFYVVLQGGKLYFCPSDRAIMFLGNYTANTWVNITLGYAGPTVNADRNLGYWLDGTGHTVNLNPYGAGHTGSGADQGYIYTYSPFGHDFYLGKTDMSSTGLTWKAKVVRLRNTVEAISWYPYNDTTTITVDDYPYQKTVQKVTKSWVRSTIAQLEAKMNVATTSAAGLMAAADKAAIAGLTTHGIYPNALTKSGAVDFNEVIDHGFYFIGGDTPHLNYPETYQQSGGTLQVIRTGNYLTQTFIPLNINKTFIRSCLNVLSDSSERTFSTWRRLLTAPDITESKARPGYFKLPGGTIVQWGKKTAITRDEENCYISFPIAFPTMFLSATAIASSGTLSATGVIVSLSEASTTSMTMVVKNHPNTGSPDMDQYIEMYWFAVGF